MATGDRRIVRLTPAGGGDDWVAFGVVVDTPDDGIGQYVQTFATADKTLGAYTADVESTPYVGIDNLQLDIVYATVADVNALRVAYENLRALVEDATAMLNSVVDDLQRIGLVV